MTGPTTGLQQRLITPPITKNQTPNTKHQTPSTQAASRTGSTVASSAPELPSFPQNPSSTTAESFADKLIQEIIENINIAPTAAHYAQIAKNSEFFMKPVVSFTTNSGQRIIAPNQVFHPVSAFAAVIPWLAAKTASHTTTKPTKTSSFKFDIADLTADIKKHLGIPVSHTEEPKPQQPLMLHSASFSTARTDVLNQVWDYTVTTQKGEQEKSKTFYIRISPIETGFCANKLGVLTEGERNITPKGSVYTTHQKGNFLEAPNGKSYLCKGTSTFTTKNKFQETSIQREGLFTAPNAKNTEEYGLEHLMEGSKTTTQISTQGAKTIKTTVSEDGKFAPIGNNDPDNREAFISGVRNYTETITDNKTNKTTLIKKNAEIISPPSTKTNNSDEAEPSTSTAAPNTAADNTAVLITLDDDALTTPPTNDPFAPNADTLGVTNNPSPLSKH